MNAETFGAFVAACRKSQHMTQLELAQKLHITDKAVSRWERGKGFPDISLLVPLSEALGISILELMRSEKLEKEDHYTNEDLKSMVATVAEMKKKSSLESRLIRWTAVPVIALTTLITVLSGRGSLLVGLWLGCAAALSIIGLCLFAMDRPNPGSRKADGLFMAAGTGGTLLLLLMMGADSSILLGGLFLYLCVTVAAAVR
ncbi:MAG TPA: helix-turn-helix transcriptional regulator [Candidatus Pullilachnospira intestinigallinarum]|nr:helix-turn-helix transcriptional regulator [Candidatus Pullilachnospira intestinigallinarum]